MNITKRAFQIGHHDGMLVELHEAGERIATAELMLPADDGDIRDCIASLRVQAQRHGIRIHGTKEIALFQSIEMGAVI
jgi:hypothetical protein